LIKASSQRQIDRLIDDLTSGHAVTRDGAVARLTVIGARAVDRLAKVAVDLSARSSARTAAFRALEAIADPRALDAALQSIDDADTEVVAAAIGAASVFLRAPRGVNVLDRLTALALDRRRPRTVRLAAVHALDALGSSTLGPLFKALDDDPDEEVRAAAATRGSKRAAAKQSPADWLTNAIEHTLPDEPARLRHALSQEGGRLSLLALHRLIQRIREREGAEPASGRPEWTTTRAAAHAVLAARGSRIALYDVRETLEAAADPLPVEFLTALTEVGDATCLQAIAAAYSKARSKRDEDWWRSHLAGAFRAIVKREKITKRHAAMKKLEKRWPGLVGGLGLKA
jgi:hypothetical protein